MGRGGLREAVGAVRGKRIDSGCDASLDVGAGCGCVCGVASVISVWVVSCGACRGRRKAAMRAGLLGGFLSCWLLVHHTGLLARLTRLLLVAGGLQLMSVSGV